MLDVTGVLSEKTGIQPILQDKLGGQHPQDNPCAGVDGHGIKMWGSHWTAGMVSEPRGERC